MRKSTDLEGDEARDHEEANQKAGWAAPSGHLFLEGFPGSTFLVS
jgi:hypothetical protein